HIRFYGFGGEQFVNTHERLNLAPFVENYVANNLNVTGVDVRLQYFHLPLTKHHCVVIGRRTVDQEVLAPRHLLEHIFSLKVSHARVVEGNVKGKSIAEDEPVVGNDRYFFLVRGFHYCRCLAGIRRNDDQHVHAAVDEFFTQPHLFVRVAVRHFNHAFASQGVDAFREQFLIEIPAVNHVTVHEQTYSLCVQVYRCQPHQRADDHNPGCHEKIVRYESILRGPMTFAGQVCVESITL